MGTFDDQKKKLAQAAAEGAADAATKAGRQAARSAWAGLGRLVRGAADRIARATDDALTAAEAHLEEREQEHAKATEQAGEQAEAWRAEAQAKRQAVLDREARAREELARLKQQAGQTEDDDDPR